MRKLGLVLAACLSTAAAAAPPPAPPKLIVAISVDQFSADLFDEYRAQFTGGLARLSRGALFRNGYQGHNATETCPGHSTILTGSRPSRTGIIANSWFDLGIARSDKRIYCAEDERAPGSSSSDYVVSPLHLKVPTLGELMKARNPATRVVAVAGKDRAAVMMTGRGADQRWYWDGKTYATDLKDARVPASVTAARTAVAALIAAPGEPLESPPLCASKSRTFALAEGASVGSGRFARAAGDVRNFRYTPAFDGMTLALGAKLIDEMKLGQGAASDLIAIGLSATDYVGHGFGSGGEEMCLQLLSLDRDLGDFLGLLDRRGIDYAVVLTADHGGEDIPERLRARGVPQADRVDPALVPATLGKAVAAKLGLSGPVLIGEGASGEVYLDRALKPADRKRALGAVLAAYRANPQVEAIFTKEQIARHPSPKGPPDRWSFLDRARASFDPERSGDLLVMLKKHVTPIPNPGPGYVATHGSPWDYDRRVPIMFWRRGMTPVTIEGAVETADILPTLGAMIALPVNADSIDGHCLAGVEGATCPSR